MKTGNTAPLLGITKRAPFIGWLLIIDEKAAKVQGNKNRKKKHENDKEHNRAQESAEQRI